MAQGISITLEGSKELEKALAFALAAGRDAVLDGIAETGRQGARIMQVEASSVLNLSRPEDWGVWELSQDGRTATIGPARSLGDVPIFMEFGTEPHTIVPKNAKALRFEVGGEVVFAMKVNHPGTKPYFFVSKTAEKLRPVYLNNMAEALSASLVGFDARAGRFRSRSSGRFVQG